MASKGTELGLALVFVLMLWKGASAQSGCANALMTLAPCLNFLTGSSSGPSTSCCSQLTWVVQNQPQCLCSLVNSGAALGIAIIQTMPLALPVACNLQIPPVSQCSSASGPTASAASPAVPASAPVGSPSSDSTPSDAPNNTPHTTTPTTPSQTNTPLPAGAGSKTVPSTNRASSAATPIKSPHPVAMFLLFAVSFALTRTRF